MNILGIVWLSSFQGLYRSVSLAVSFPEKPKKEHQPVLSIFQFDIYFTFFYSS